MAKILTVSILCVFLALPALGQQASDSLDIDGLLEPVEVLTDRWGIAHIYAESEHDLFFAQGYAAARERLFQFELWRRQATGTTAEILGERELKRDIGTRLFLFRGDMEQEMSYYHPNGVEIITAFVEGINTYIGETEKNAELLPLEFELLDIKPGYWTPEVAISRHQGLLGNIEDELDYGRAVATLGPERVVQFADFHPGTPDITLDESIQKDWLFDDILELYRSFRRPVRFTSEDLAAEFRDDDAANEWLLAQTDASELSRDDRESIGSNNWVVDGSLSQSGYPMMANDPHRVVAAPSLRHWAHLVAPGWNVIGGGEPTIPGISIGHNEFGAWGLTVFPTDGEDLYVYHTNPDNPNEYKYAGQWESMRVIRDTIRVRGQNDHIVDLRYTRHGPVVFQNEAENVAFAVRAAWMEIGGAPYLASLRMDQAENWEQFREACNYSHIPGENMVWAGRDGVIGWQAVGIAPIRRHWSGLVPVPGDGRYEWDGYLPIKAKPHVENPTQGFIATANENNVPRNYPYRDAVGWEWSSPYRSDRIHEVLRQGRRNSVMDMMRLQTDYLSIPARTLVPLLQEIDVRDRALRDIQGRLLEWDFVLGKNSVEAGIYVAWERRLLEALRDLAVPEEASSFVSNISMKKAIEWLVAPGGMFGEDPIAGRDRLLVESLRQAHRNLIENLGTDPAGWNYGQENYKHAYFFHPLSNAVDDQTRKNLDVGTMPRGGNSYTVNNTSGSDNQRAGASFRIVVDTGNWDASVGMNSPGQSGNIDSPYYKDLFELWANDKFFPIFYSRDRVEEVTEKWEVWR